MYLVSTDLQQFPADLRDLIGAEIGGLEKITWVDRPLLKRFSFRALPIFVFGVFWTAFSLSWIAAASGFKVPDFTEGFDLFPLFGIPFVLIGVWMLCSPWLMLYRAKRTAYVLTTSRAIIFEGGLSTTIRSFAPARLNDLQRKQRADGSGDLIFEKKFSHNSDGNKQTTTVGFLCIANVKEVEGMIRKLVYETGYDKA